MNEHDSLVQVKRLLALLPGVELAWAHTSPALIRLGLAICVPRSLAILAHVAAKTNLPLHVATRFECADRNHDDPDCVRYDLRVPVESSTVFEPPSNLQMVGGTLACRLKDDGLLDPGEANELLRAWNFDVR